MRRTLLAAAAVALAVSGCQSDPAEEAAPTGGFWGTAPANEEQRLEVLERARLIDPCALLTRDRLGELGEVREVTQNDISACHASVGPESLDERIELSWSVEVPGTASERAEEGEVIQVGDASVRLLSDADALGEESVASMTRLGCHAAAELPSGAEFVLDIRISRDQDACAVATELTESALTEWWQDPRPGTSPDGARTVLTGADPCAVTGKLGVTVPADEQTLSVCRFVYRDSEVIVTYEYEEESLATGDEAAFTVGERPVYALGPSGGGEFGNIRSYSAVVGPALYPGVDPGTFSSPTVPSVRATGTEGVVEDVLRELLPTIS